MTDKKKYNLSDLLEQCDLKAPMPEAVKEWDEIQPVGRESDNTPSEEFKQKILISLEEIKSGQVSEYKFDTEKVAKKKTS